MTDARFRAIGFDPRKMRHRKIDRVFWLGEMFNALIARSNNPQAVADMVHTHSMHLARERSSGFVTR